MTIPDRRTVDGTLRAFARHLRSAPGLKRLTTAERTRLRKLVRTFAELVDIQGLDGLTPTYMDWCRVAVSCATLYIGRPEWPYPPVDKVYLSPYGFDEHYRPSQDHARMAGYYVGPERVVFMARDALTYSFKRPADGYHVGYHEFAHGLDYGSGFYYFWWTGVREQILGGIPYGEIDGEPPHLSRDLEAAWREAMARAHADAGNIEGVLDEYAAQSPAETFARAVEFFFERPAELNARDQPLYACMRAFFNQDPLRGSAPTRAPRRKK